VDISSIWINILDFDNPVDVDDKTELLKEYSLSQNYPNPFNPSTTINYSVLSNVKIIVYDILGCEVATLVNENKPAGNYEITFNVGQASSLSS